MGEIEMISGQVPDKLAFTPKKSVHSDFYSPTKISSKSVRQATYYTTPSSVPHFRSVLLTFLQFLENKLN